MPKYYPICLDLNDFECLVVGGGNVALRKVKTLLKYGGRVTVVAPKIHESIQLLAEERNVVLLQRPYRSVDLVGKRLVFVATNDTDLNREIVAEAHKNGVLVNVVDVPEQCDFVVPAIVQRGQFMLAISTGGACPAYAKRLRKTLESEFDQAYGDYMCLLERLRREILARTKDGRRSAMLIGRLLEEDFLEDIRQTGLNKAETKARKLLDSWTEDADQ